MNKMKRVLVTGGAGYVGAILIPKLLKAGYTARVLDLFIYGDDVFKSVVSDPQLELVKGDIRNKTLLAKALENVDAVIHLACISNDPSYELNPALGQSINYDAFPPLVELSLKNKVKRFIYASSSSVYGIKNEPEVTEDLKLEPLTDYSKFKALCEDYLLENVKGNEMTCLIVRPSTVCGYSPRLRLDLTVNILTHHALERGVITVFGGNQKRPNIHIEDMTDFYIESLKYPDDKIHRKIFNLGFENHTVDEIAEMVKNEVGPHVDIRHQATDDLRSYHVSSQKIYNELGFKASRSIQQAVKDLQGAFKEGLVPNAANDPRYYNIKTMQLVDLK